jgi:small subunit ribosomal protein S20
LANHKSAIKRIRVNERRRIRNRIYIARTRTELRKAREALSAAPGTAVDLQAARTATLSAIRQLDKAVSKGMIHKNQAARRKSRMMAKLNALEAANA